MGSPPRPPFRPLRRLAAAPGFSLVEALIAAGLLATVMASLAPLFAGATRANMRAGDTTWATILAAQKIEELRAGPFPEPRVDPSVDYLDRGGNRLDDPGSTRRAYTRRWWTEPLPSASGATIVITVAVSRYRHGDAETSGDGVRSQEAARLVTLRTRRAP